jgi:hypothetical protein
MYLYLPLHTYRFEPCKLFIAPHINYLYLLYCTTYIQPINVCLLSLTGGLRRISSQHLANKIPILQAMEQNLNLYAAAGAATFIIPIKRLKH